MSDMPKVSVVMSVYNGEKFLMQTLDSVLAQTLREIEILLVCNGSTDSTLSIMQEYAGKDSRIRVYPKEFAGAGTGRNYGLARATGKYVSFLDGDDLFEPDMLSRLYAYAESHQAEIVAFGSDKMYPNGSYAANNYPIMQNLPNQDVFSALEMRSCFRTISYNGWDKFFLRQFLMDNQLHFLDQSLHEDTYLCLTSICCAQRICVLPDKMVHYRVFGEGITSNKVKLAQNAYICFRTFKNWLIENQKWTQFRTEYANAAIEIILEPLVGNFQLEGEERKNYYNRLRSEILHELALADVSISTLYKPFRFFEIQRILSMDFESYCAAMQPGLSGNKHTPELIVSMTSYPKRIKKAWAALKSILSQTEKADRVILWLTKEDFPNGEQDLPEQLLELKKYGLTIEWCSSMGSYQKLVPSLQKYPDAVIVTADDDMFYNSDWLKLLWDFYQKHPDCICCHRPAKLEIKNGDFVWTTSGKKHYQQATFLHRGISQGGMLYPPGSLHDDATDVDLFMELAPTNDDLWFWVMAIRNGTRISAVDYAIPAPKYIEGSQAVTLSSVNFGEEQRFERDFKKLLLKFPGVQTLLEEEFNNL